MNSSDNNDYDDNDMLRNIISISSSLDENMITTAAIPQPEADSNVNPSLCYVNDPHVRLRFLRAELFDAKKSVRRFVNFFIFHTRIIW
mmetsp:Transcript_31821/g.36544  ORF Transcript_31821/g.36544 Transcript_31821/m.36544 type:complete len:88 (-) Transcript_31821:81-344(-)